VGLSPTTYRRLGGYTHTIPISANNDTADDYTGVVSGRIWTRPTNEPCLIFVGLFPSRIPEGKPARCVVMRGPGRFRLDGVPEGTWHLLAQAVTGTAQEALHRPFAGDHALSVAAMGPIEVRSDTLNQSVDLRLRPMRSLDPPVLLALLDVRMAMAPPATQSPAGWNSAA
jgi:hypothetical protein